MNDAPDLAVLRDRRRDHRAILALPQAASAGTDIHFMTTGKDPGGRQGR